MANRSTSDGKNHRNEGSPKKRSARPRLLRYGSAVVSVTLASVTCLFLDPLLQRHLPFLWFFAAILLAAWYGGFGPAVFALVLSVASAAFFFLPPAYSLSIAETADQVALLLFFGVGLGLVLYSHGVSLLREVAQARLEQVRTQAETDLLQAMPERMAEIEAQLNNHIAEAELAEKRLAAQYRVSQVLTHAHSIQDAAYPILQALCETLGWEVGLFWTVDAQAGVLRCVEVCGVPTGEIEEFERCSKQFKFSKGEGFTGQVWAADRVIWVSDLAKETDFPRWSLAAKVGLHEAIGIPIRNGVEFLAVMEFLGRKIGKPNEHFLKMMACIGSEISHFIERRTAESTLQAQDHDRRIAKQIQDGLLPKVMPEIPGFKAAGKCQFATEVGGDCFDFIPMLVKCNHCLGVVVGDASGHGVGAALLMAETRAYLRALALTQGDVGTILTLTNERLANGTTADHFVTLLLARLNPRNMTLDYVGAGHCPGYVLDGQGNTKAVLTSAGMPLGVDSPGEFPASSEIALDPDDVVVLFSDGIIEASSPDGKPFGLERILGSVRAHRHRSPDEIIEALLQAMKDHTQRPVQQDDATVVIVKAEPRATAR